MRCANLNCRAMADHLLMGTLALVEFETAPDDRISHAAGGFPICIARTRYFWLCETCSRLFRIRRWNSSGLILEPQHTDGFRLPEPQARRKSAATSVSAGPERPRGLYGAA
jgi:hypothetical protein